MQYLRTHRQGIMFGMSVVCAFLLCSTPVYAQVAYKNPLTVIPGITDSATLQSISQLGIVGFINGIMRFIFVLAAIASVIMIVLIGFQYVVAEKSPKGVAELKGKMTSLAWGVGMIASTWIILNTINPDIVNNINVFSTRPSASVPTTPSASSEPFDAKRKEFLTSEDPNAKSNAAIYEAAIKSSTCTPQTDTNSFPEYKRYTVYCIAPN